MKAFLLAAGLGTRLRPLTDDTPKCLVPIAGFPLLSYWLRLLASHGFDDVLVNTHHLAQRVDAFVSERQQPVRVTTVHEPVLLGSAGTVRANRQWVADGAPFLIAYADNLTGADLGALMSAHVASGAVLTAALFRTDQPTRCGIVEIRGGGDRGEVIAFEEKPAQPRSNLANAGVYVTDSRIFDYIPDGSPVDFGRDVLPALAGRMYGMLLSEPLIDIGTFESYERAQSEVARMGLVERLALAETQS